MIYRIFSFLCLSVFISSAAVAAMQDRPSVQLQVLDKSTARTTTLEAKIGETIEYGSLFIKVQACRESDPLDKPESSAFLQIWEVPLNAKKSEWVFSGWMFASSPALSAMDHAVYDVWVLKCLGGEPAPSAESTNKVEIKPSLEAEGEQQESLEVIEEEVLEDSVPPLEPQTEEVPQHTDKSVESVIEDVISDSVNYE